ncbi:hypothetical protein ASD52_33520 [Ensifer sp. Root142]|nr:hypothetical protein ASD00_30470 [Ensifer sp. Root31]KQW78568.1 hypothetical protein ASD03_26160 [Ensifer sp. Root127]KQY68509.1 hypothetical protein ASD52_33520 [Ensifer sp. Root142]
MTEISASFRRQRHADFQFLAADLPFAHCLLDLALRGHADFLQEGADRLLKASSLMAELLCVRKSFPVIK